MIAWYLARGAGLAAFLTLSIATGMGAVTARRHANVDNRVVLQYLHRAAALSGVALLGLHISMLLVDSYAHVGWVGALVPLQSGYRPLAVTLGVLSMYLLAIVTLTGILRGRFAGSERAARWWRAIHVSAYAGWAMSAWHFLTAGSDAGRWWARLVLFAGVAVVAAGLAVRLGDRRLVTTRTQAPVAAGRLDARDQRVPAVAGSSRFGA